MQDISAANVTDGRRPGRTDITIPYYVPSKDGCIKRYFQQRSYDNNLILALTSIFMRYNV